jgi:hypothetical protein
MPQGALTVQSDGTLRVESHPDEDTAALEATLSGFADLVCPTAEPRVYCLTAPRYGGRDEPVSDSRRCCRP